MDSIVWYIRKKPLYNRKGNGSSVILCRNLLRQMKGSTMIKENQKYFNRLHVVVDAAVIYGSFCFSYYIRFENDFTSSKWGSTSNTLVCWAKQLNSRMENLLLVCEVTGDTIIKLRHRRWLLKVTNIVLPISPNTSKLRTIWALPAVDPFCYIIVRIIFWWIRTLKTHFQRFRELSRGSSS